MYNIGNSALIIIQLNVKLLDPICLYVYMVLISPTRFLILTPMLGYNEQPPCLLCQPSVVGRSPSPSLPDFAFRPKREGQATLGTVTFFSNRYLRHIIYIIGKSKKYTFQRYLIFIVISFVASTTLFQRCNTK